MNKRIARCFVPLTLVVLAAAFVAAGGEETRKTTPAPSAKLAEISWMAGTWKADVSGDQLDEYWSPPSGDSMFGAFRWMKGGKPWMYEILMIAEEGNDVVLRLKHFDHKLVGWEEKAESVAFRLVGHDAQTAEFERIESEERTKLTYRKPSPDEFIVELEHTTKEGMKKDEFRFRRANS